MTESFVTDSLDSDDGGFGASSAVARLTIFIREAAIDCECRSRIDEVLVRISEWENRREARQYLADARVCHERLEAAFSFLRDLGDLQANEPDRSVYEEMALLFDQIAEIATQGAAAMRRLSVPST